MRISVGSSISARAISTSFCSPPDSEPARVVAALRDEREALGDLLGAAADEPRVAEDVAADQHVVPHGHQREEAALLRHVHDAGLEHAPRREARRSARRRT